VDEGTTHRVDEDNPVGMGARFVTCPTTSSCISYSLKGTSLTLRLRKLTCLGYSIFGTSLVGNGQTVEERKEAGIVEEEDEEQAAAYHTEHGVQHFGPRGWGLAQTGLWVEVRQQWARQSLPCVGCNHASSFIIAAAGWALHCGAHYQADPGS